MINMVPTPTREEALYNQFCLRMVWCLITDGSPSGTPLANRDFTQLEAFLCSVFGVPASSSKFPNPIPTDPLTGTPKVNANDFWFQTRKLANAQFVATQAFIAQQALL